MRIKLLQTIIEDGKLKVSMRRGREPVPFMKGVEVEMSDTSGQKYIDRGVAEEVRPHVASDLEAAS